MPRNHTLILRHTTKLGMHSWDNAAIHLIKEAWDEGVCIDKIICDDDSSIKSNLRHSWAELIKSGKMSTDQWLKTLGGNKSNTRANYLRTDFLCQPHAPD